MQRDHSPQRAASPDITEEPSLYRRLLNSAVASLGVLLMGACSSPSHDARPEEPSIGPVTDIPAISKVSDIKMPLLRYVSSAADDNAYWAAVVVEKQKCAAGFGVESTEGIGADNPPPMIEDVAQRRYGLIDADEVARFGYMLAPEPSSTGGKKWSPDSREYLIMKGMTVDGTIVTTDRATGKKIPEHGCGAEAFRRLREGEISPASNQLVNDLLEQSWNLTMADSRALKAQAEWSACMKGKWYDFKARWDAGNSVAGRSAGVQLQMAKLDLACAVETNYNGIWFAVDSAYQKRLIADHQSDLAATMDAERKVMDRVSRALEGSS